jgi:hypothetical protein
MKKTILMSIVAFQKERRIEELSLHGVMREKEGIMF